MLDRERKLLFDLNVLDEVNDRYGSLEEMGAALTDKKDGAKTLRWLLTMMLNEAADDGEGIHSVPNCCAWAAVRANRRSMNVWNMRMENRGRVES